MKELNIIMSSLQLEFLNTIKIQINAPHNSLSAHKTLFHLIYGCSTTLAPPVEHAVLQVLCKQDAQDLSAC